MKSPCIILVLFLALFFLFKVSYSQDQKKIDSLVIELSKESSHKMKLQIEFHLEEARWNMRLEYWDSLAERAGSIGFTQLRAHAINNMGYISMNSGEVNLAKAHYKKSLQLFRKLKDVKGEATGLNNLGYIYQHIGDIDKAFMYYNKCLDVRERIGDHAGIAQSLNNIGFIYDDLGEVEKALNYYHESLSIQEKIGDEIGIATSLNNIGTLYDAQGDLKKGLEYYKESLNKRIVLGYKMDIANSYTNIGSVHQKLKQFDKAFEMAEKSIVLQTEIDDKHGLALSYLNLGVFYSERNDFANAAEYYQKSLKIRIGLGDRKNEAKSLYKLGELYFYQRDFDNALKFGKRSLIIAKKLGFPLIIKDTGKLLSDVYKNVGSYKEAIENYELYILMRDSINNEKTQTTAVKKQVQYEYEKQMLAIQKEQEKKELIALKEKQQQQWVLYSVSGGLFLVVLFYILLSNRFRLIKYQKKVIEDQKEEVEYQKGLVDEKNNDITASIRYARRIQKAILPKDESIEKLLPENFVLYKPKDIVSGDFYWTASKNGKTHFAVFDCTGHGVPGAFMSMIGNSLLNEVVLDRGIIQPSTIFDEVRSGLIKVLKQTGEDVTQKDGMDGVLCTWNQNGKLEYATAYNSLYLIRQGELIETKGDHQPVGFHIGEVSPFKNHNIDLQKEDVIYLLSDGFQDQFGGNRGKKFKSSKLKNKLLEIHLLPMNEQKAMLEEEFDTWKGDLDQVDDVCIMGIRF